MQPPQAYSAAAASGLAVLGAVAFVAGAALILWPLWAAGLALVAGGCYSVVSRRLMPLACGPDPRERLVAAEQLDALEQARRDRRTGDRDSDRLERLPWLLAEPSARSRSACSIASAVNGSTVASASSAAASTVSIECRSVVPVVRSKKKPANSGYWPSRSIFSWTSGPVARISASGQVVPLFAQVRDQCVCVGVLVERAQVDAVHPVELLVVERRRAAADPLEREPADELVGDP